MQKGNQSSIADAVMKEIKDKGIKIRPRIYFITGSVLLGIGLTLTFLTAIFFINILLFRLRTFGHFDYLRFGEAGIRPFLMTFPWLIMLVALLGVFVGIYLLRRCELTYKHSLLAVVALAIFSVLATGLIIDRVGINKPLQKIRPARVLYQEEFRGETWVVGEITKVEEHQLTLATPDDQTITVLWSEETLLPFGSNFQIGGRVRVVGEWNSNKTAFIAKVIGKGGFPQDRFRRNFPNNRESLRQLPPSFAPPYQRD